MYSSGGKDASALVIRRCHGNPLVAGGSASVFGGECGVVEGERGGTPPPPPLPSLPKGAVLLRVQDQCVTSEVFGSVRCDCKQQLDFSLDTLARLARASWMEEREGSGVEGGSSSGRSGSGGSEILGLVVYLQQEGRGVGLAAKVAAYALQEEGGGGGAGSTPGGPALDTVDANRAMGLPDDTREYSAVVDILRDLGVVGGEEGGGGEGGRGSSGVVGGGELEKLVSLQPLYLLSNNPRKEECLGVTLAGRIPCLVPPVSKEAAKYLKAKALRMGHDIPKTLWEGAL